MCFTDITARRTLIALLALTVLTAACGRVPSPALPRTTQEGIRIELSDTRESVVLPGCHAYWQSRGLVAPDGSCEQLSRVRRFVATGQTGSVDVTVMGEPTAEPLYPLQLAARNVTDSLSLFVVLAPADAAAIRLTSATGRVADEVRASGELIALVGRGSGFTVSALDANRAVIASCPPDGVTLEGVVYPCSPHGTTPVTTVPSTGDGPSVDRPR